MIWGGAEEILHKFKLGTANQGRMLHSMQANGQQTQIIQRLGRGGFRSRNKEKKKLQWPNILSKDIDLQIMDSGNWPGWYRTQYSNRLCSFQVIHKREDLRLISKGCDSSFVRKMFPKRSSDQLVKSKHIFHSTRLLGRHKVRKTIVQHVDIIPSVHQAIT